MRLHVGGRDLQRVAADTSEPRTSRPAVEKLAWALIREAMGSGVAREERASAAALAAWALLGGKTAKAPSR